MVRRIFNGRGIFEGLPIFSIWEEWHTRVCYRRLRLVVKFVEFNRYFALLGHNLTNMSVIYCGNIFG